MKAIENLKLDSKEIKLALFFILIFSFFMHWSGDNAWSRYDLTASMAEDQDFNIAERSNNTVDRLIEWDTLIERNSINETVESLGKDSDYEDIYSNFTYIARTSSTVYSDKAPMSSIIAMPAYIIANHISGEDKLNSSSPSKPVSLSFEKSLKMTLMVLTASVFFGVGLLISIYRYLKPKVDEETAFYTTLIIGIATPIFTYATSFFGVINAAFFGFTSLIVMEKALDGESRRLLVLSGLLSALAFSTEYYAGIITLSLTSYLIYFRGRESLYFLSGAFIGALPLFIYHWSITGNPFIPPIFSNYLTNIGFTGQFCIFYSNCIGNIYGFIMNPLRILSNTFKLLFLSSRGIFFYSPILLVTLPGTYYLYRKNRIQAALLSGTFMTFLIFQASRVNWLAGVSFGPRYAIVALPFLALPLALGIRKLTEKDRIWKLAILLLFTVSVFQTMLGFGSWPGLESGEYNHFTSLAPAQANFYEGLMGNANEYGPKSEIMMSLTDRYKGLDITYRAPYGPEHFEISNLLGNEILLSTRFIPMMIIIAFSTLIIRRRSDRLFYLGIGATVLLLILSANLSENYIQGESYREMELGGAVNGSMTVISNTDQNEIPYLEVVKSSPREQVDISVKVNGKERFKNDLKGRYGFALPSAERGGRNKIEIEADGCTVPAKYGNSSNNRCISFALSSLETKTAEDFQKPVPQGFYGKRIEDEPWMSRDSEIIFSTGPDKGISSVSMEVLPFLEDSKPRFSLNGEYVEIIEIEEDNGRTYHILNGSTVEGINYLKIDSSECRIPAEETDSNDDRCLSYRLKNITMSEDADQTIYMDGWHSREESGRWMSKEAELLRRTRKNNAALTLDLAPYSSLENNTLEVSINGRNIRNISLNRRKEVMMPIEENQMIHRVRLKSRNGCLNPSNISNSTESRCMSVYLRNISTTSINREVLFQKGWYSEETDSSNSYRWMKNKSYILFNSTGKEIISFSAKRYEEIGNSTLSIFADGKKISDFSSSKIEKGELDISTEPGITTLRFESSKGCAIPRKSEPDSDDYRCLSYRVSGLNIQRKSFGEGWYSKEGGKEFSYRWMGEESTMDFIADGGRKNLEFDFKPYKHLPKPAALNVIVNEESVGTLTLKGPGRVRKSIDIETERGVNKLKLKSQTGCEMPYSHERMSQDRRCLSFQFSKLEINDN